MRRRSKGVRFPADPLKRHLGGGDPRESILKSVCRKEQTYEQRDSQRRWADVACSCLYE